LPTSSPAPGDGQRLRSRGSNQVGMRQYNERVVLQAIRSHGGLPGADIARQTHLTAQTVSLITKRLLDENLLTKGEPVRGKVGQPSVPLALNPDGAFSVGIKVGRRSMDVLLVDFVGAVRARWSSHYDYPDADLLLAEIGQRLRDIRRRLGPAQRDRMQGIGIAAPLGLGGWQTLLNMPAGVAQRWQRLDLRAAVAALTDWPVTLLKDTAAACVAELVAGRGRSVPSFLYVFVDTFIGGGLVIDSHLRHGPNGNAGAIGSMPMGAANLASGDAPAQMLSVASLITLESRYREAGLDSGAVSDLRALQAPWRPHTEAWLREAGAAMALAANTAACLLDIDNVIVDGSFSRELLAGTMHALEAALDRFSWEGIARPRVLAGTIGTDARALGGALMPLYENFAPDRDLFLKVGA
jgi:predicted NBD/HSP70 family sugar kinase